MSMKEIVLDRLQKIEDLEQRKLLKSIMTGVFLPLVEYQEEMNRKLEKRVFQEIAETEDRYDIYTTVCPRDELDPLHEFLYPMLQQDLEKTLPDLASIQAGLGEKEEVKLLTVFLACDFLKVRELIERPRVFGGKLVTTQGTRNIHVRLQQNRAYIQEIEALHTIFQRNGVVWKTINHPYAYKFFDVLLISCEGEIAEEEEMIEISVHLEEYEPYKKIDIIPLWNIERLTLKNLGFPVPADDRVNYEHVLSVRKTGTAHGYLVDGDEINIRYSKRTPEEITIVSPREKSGTWDVRKITQPTQGGIGGRRTYELLSNQKRKDRFLDGFASRQATVVRARGEIMRIIHSFEAADCFELTHVEVGKMPGRVAETYNMNPFLLDAVRLESEKKTIRLHFTAHTANRFILHDVMSFLVSEVQMYFPDYKCEGVLS